MTVWKPIYLDRPSHLRQASRHEADGKVLAAIRLLRDARSIYWNNGFRQNAEDMDSAITHADYLFAPHRREENDRI